MPETTFENAKVGDKVWSVEYGWGEIIEISNRVRVEFTRLAGYTGCKSFDKHGRRLSEYNKTLFWDEIKIVPPERPKIKVKKKVEVWLNVYPEEPLAKGNIHYSREQADYIAWSERIVCVRLTGTYEVEE